MLQTCLREKSIHFQSQCAGSSLAWLLFNVRLWLARIHGYFKENHPCSALIMVAVKTVVLGIVNSIYTYISDQVLMAQSYKLVWYLLRNRVHTQTSTSMCLNVLTIKQERFQ